MGALTDSRADEGIPDLRPELGELGELLGLRLKGNRLFIPTKGCGGAGGVACRYLLTRADMLRVEIRGDDCSKTQIDAAFLA